MFATRKSHRRSTKIRYSLLSAAALLAATQFASAATFTWGGNINNTWDTTTNNWGASTHWTNTSADQAIFNLATPASVSVAGTITLLRAITFDTSGWTLTNGSGTLSNTGSGGKVGVYTGYFDSDTDTISATIVNTTATIFVKAGWGTVTLSGTNSYTGATTVTNGTLRLNASTGSINSASGLTLDGSTFIYDNTSSANVAMSQTMGALAGGGSVNAEGGEGTVINIQGNASSSTLTFASSSLSAVGSAVNFISGGSANTNNEIKITTFSSSGGAFFNGADYAVKDATGYIRVAVYGVDTGVGLAFMAADISGASTGGSNLGNYLVTTQSIANQGIAAAQTIKFGGSGPINMTLATGTTVLSLGNGAVDGGILRSGGGSTTISGPAGASIALVNSVCFSTDSAIDTLTLDLKVTGTPVLIKTGAGTLFMTANAVNTYGQTGTPPGNISTFIDDGILSIVQNSNLGAQGDTVIINGGTLQATASFGLYNVNPGTNNRVLGLMNSATIDVTGSNTLTVAGVIQDASGSGSGNPGRLIKTGTGTLLLTATDSYAGGTMVNNGTLKLDANTGSLTGLEGTGNGNWQNNIFGLGGGTFDYDNTNSAATAKSLSMQATTAALAFVAGDSTVQNVKGNATTSTLTFPSMMPRTPGATGNFVTTGGVPGSSNIINLTGVPLGFINQGTFFGGSSYAVMSALSGFVRAGVYGGDANFIAADASGASLASSATSNYLVTTLPIASQATASAKTIKFGGGGTVNMNLAGSATLNLASGGLLVGDGTTASITNTGGGANINAASNIEYVFRTDSALDSLTIDVPILASGLNVFTKSGAGTLTMTANAVNTYTGGTFIDGGVLNVSQNSNLGDPGTGAAVTINNGTLQAAASFGLYNVNPGANNRAVNLENDTTFDVTGSNILTIAGVIASVPTYPGHLIKTNSGTLALSGVNTYAGATVINGGKLSIASTGNLNSTTGVTINGATANFNYNSSTAYTRPLSFGASGGTLSGAGTISASGGVTAATNAVIAPGNSPGSLTFTSGLTFNTGSTYLWANNEGNTLTGVAGTGWSSIINSGSTVAINGGTLALSFNGTTNFTSGNWSSAHNWDIISGGSVSGSFATITVNGGGNNLSQGTFTDTVTGGDLILTWTPTITTTATTYTLSAGAGSLNVLLNGSTSASASINNSGTGTADTLNFTGLVSTSGAGGTITGSASSAGPLAQSASSNNTGLMFQGTAYGSATLTPSVTTATNGTLGGNATNNGITTATVNVGEANADNSNSQTSFTGTALTGTVGATGSYAGLASRVFTATAGTGGAGTLNSEATLLAGLSTNGNTVSMTWRTRTTGEVYPNATDPSVPSSTPHGLVSDVVRLTGMNLAGGNTRGATVQTDDFVLQMSYSGVSGDEEANEAATGGIVLAYLDPASTAWTNAVLGNFTVDGNTGQFAMTDFLGSYSAFVADENTAHPGWTLNDVLGSWGVDTAATTDANGSPIDGDVWAVLNHNSDFGVLAVPEPVSLSLLGLGAMGLLASRRRRR